MQCCQTVISLALEGQCVVQEACEFTQVTLSFLFGNTVRRYTTRDVCELLFGDSEDEMELEVEEDEDDEEECIDIDESRIVEKVIAGRETQQLPGPGCGEKHNNTRKTDNRRRGVIPVDIETSPSLHIDRNTVVTPHSPSFATSSK